MSPYNNYKLFFILYELNFNRVLRKQSPKSWYNIIFIKFINLKFFGNSTTLAI